MSSMQFASYIQSYVKSSMPNIFRGSDDFFNKPGQQDCHNGSFKF